MSSSSKSDEIVLMINSVYQMANKCFENIEEISKQIKEIHRSFELDTAKVRKNLKTKQIFVSQLLLEQYSEAKESMKAVGFSLAEIQTTDGSELIERMRKLKINVDFLSSQTALFVNEKNNKN